MQDKTRGDSPQPPQPGDAAIVQLCPHCSIYLTRALVSRGLPEPWMVDGLEPCDLAEITLGFLAMSQEWLLRVLDAAGGADEAAILRAQVARLESDNLYLRHQLAGVAG